MGQGFSVKHTLDGTDHHPELRATGGGAFETSDFYLACYLRCIGYALDDVRRDGRRVVFVFGDKPGRKTDLMAFFGNKAEVNPLQFVAAIKDLKTLIHNS
ncbi:MAG TPA: DUF5659 domain-containing protein [Bryobacteraceae bacterium]|nr:DUF5659 domain-containing protein [Bryobacteraceae bacterium]HPU72401.1 DUF5659 domain-containing protein [Bryobacteraceae bacterium]